jgi:hypothetical protein
MNVIKLFFDSYEQDLFEFVGADSWLDLFECLLACSLVVFFVAFTLLLPLTLLFFMFISPLLW